jgi:hypothetical protein
MSESVKMSYLKGKAVKIEHKHLEVAAPEGHPNAGEIIKMDQTYIETAEGWVMTFPADVPIQPGQEIRITFDAKIMLARA